MLAPPWICSCSSVQRFCPQPPRWRRSRCHFERKDQTTPRARCHGQFVGTCFCFFCTSFLEGACFAGIGLSPPAAAQRSRAFVHERPVPCVRGRLRPFRQLAGAVWKNCESSSMPTGARLFAAALLAVSLSPCRLACEFREQALTFQGCNEVPRGLRAWWCEVPRHLTFAVLGDTCWALGVESAFADADSRGVLAHVRWRLCWWRHATRPCGRAPRKRVPPCPHDETDGTHPWLLQRYCPGHSHGTAAAKPNTAAPCLGARGRTSRSSAWGSGALGCAGAGDRGAARERLAHERGTANQWRHYRRRQPAGLGHHALLRCVPRIAFLQHPELSRSPQYAASGSAF
jgi:hypothetical protein